ncbi:oligosaccharide flippase family protein [Riemerella anatipestifer]|nr:oligosaccharide flippase family protein [Riemerella anatipestifer]
MYRNYFFSLLLNIFKIAAPIFVIPYVYREISPYDMGIVNLTITVMTYFYIFGDLGVYIYGFREVSLHKDDKAYINKLFTELFVFRSIFNTIVTSLYFLYVYKFSETVIPFHFYVIASIQLLSTFFSVEWMFEGNSKFKFVSIKTIIIRTIFLLLTFILVRGESASEFYLFTLTGFLLANNLVSFVYLQRFVVWDFKNLNLIKHWPSLFMIFIMINWSMLYFQTDKNILGIKGNIIGVGYYSMCEKILLLSSSVVFSLITISTPKLGTSLMVGIGNYKSMLTRVFHVFL